MTIWKYKRLLCLLLFSLNAHAEMNTEFKGMPCESTEQMMHTFRVIQKITKNTYEAVSIYNDDMHIIINTDKGFEFQNKGVIQGFFMRRVAVKTVRMQDGFEKNVQVYKQCKASEAKPFELKPVKDSSEEKEQPSSGASKSASCQDRCFQKEEKKKFRKGETLESCLLDACK